MNTGARILALGAFLSARNPQKWVQFFENHVLDFSITMQGEYFRTGNPVTNS